MESSVLTSLQLWTTAHWGELGSVPRDTSREKELLHPRGNGALQCKCLKEPCSAEFSSSILSSIWEHGEQLILGSPWRAVCWEILESEFHPERTPLQGTACGSIHSCFLTVQDDTQRAGALSVHSPVHFYHTASPKIGIGLSQRQWIRIYFRLKPRASDDFVLLQNRHTLPSSSILSVQCPPWPWALPSIPESCTLLWESQSLKYVVYELNSITK